HQQFSNFLYSQVDKVPGTGPVISNGQFLKTPGYSCLNIPLYIPLTMTVLRMCMIIPVSPHYSNIPALLANMPRIMVKYASSNAGSSLTLTRRKTRKGMEISNKPVEKP